MASTLLKEELIFLHIRKEEYKFYTLELISVGYNQLQLISTYGRLGTKGRESIIRISNGKQTLTEGRKMFYQKIFEKKSSGYLTKERISDAIQTAVKNEREEKRYKRKTKKENPPQSNKCDLCKKEISNSLYERIDDWARGEGNWDSDDHFIGYHRVLCIACQIDNNIYQQVIGKDSFKK